ncbi:MAG: hypothetical protein SF182_14055 [Deltaproteobacteria bacterium]|nr:hypothetical protein [Deltaproteobacteria bacterium]
MSATDSGRAAAAHGRPRGRVRRLVAALLRVARRRWYLGAVLLGLLALLWVIKDRLLFAPVEGFTLHEPGPRYEALFPYYVELCAVSQFRSEKMGAGGSPGHAVMYLKGACRDRDAPYPKLRRCRGTVVDPNDPEHGAGISVNRWFRSANWVAFDGRGQFFGVEPSGAPVTYERIEAAAQAAIDAGVFRGIALWPNPSGMETADQLPFVIRHSAGTDFALRYARSGLCGRVPVEPEMMDEIIHFLNDLNRKYTTGVIDYVWNGYSDNCVHTLRNALAAASMDEPISVRTSKLRQLFHLAIPANEAIELAALGTKGPLASFPDIFASNPMRNALLEFGWLPTRHGSVLVSLPVYPNNQLFDPQPRLLVFQGPVTLRTTQMLLKMLDEPRFTELEPNLAHFAQLYAEILATREQQDALQAVRGDRYRRVRRRYFDVIAAAAQDVQRMQAELR